MTDDAMNGPAAGAAACTLPHAALPAELELKSGEPGELAAFEDFLERMRDELDKQFQVFVALRDNAARRAGEDQPEAEAKMARADLKSAVDALSVIVRTLEKLDQMQRQLTRDRAELDSRPDSREAYDALWADVSALIEARVEEELEVRVERRLRERLAVPEHQGGAPPGGCGLSSTPATRHGPADAAA